MDTRLLKLRPPPSGIFSNVNEVIQHIHMSYEGGYRFIINWWNSAYKSERRAEDPWEYYFLPIWPDISAEERDLEVLPTGASVACTRDNIITPRLVDGKCNPLLLPKNRDTPGQLIDKHIILNEATAKEVDSFIQNNLQDPYIGLHIRGPGRLHGGAAEFRRQHGEEGNVPYSVYFDEVNRAISDNPDLKIFACSDSSLVIDEIQKEYGDRVVLYDATRSEFGEMQARHDENEGLVFDNYKLGLDMLVEAYALAGSAFFIHGNTNVANFVLCRSPNLQHKYVAA